MDRRDRSAAPKLLMAWVSPGAVHAGLGGHVLAAARALACGWLVAERGGKDPGLVRGHAGEAAQPQHALKEGEGS